MQNAKKPKTENPVIENPKKFEEMSLEEKEAHFQKVITETENALSKLSENSLAEIILKAYFKSINEKAKEGNRTKILFMESQNLLPKSGVIDFS